MRKIDLVNQKFGMLTVVSEAEKSPSGRIRWNCKCDCGNTCIVYTNNLRSGHSSSCGCVRERNLAGKKIGKLTVVECSDVKMSRGKRASSTWKCICQCGNVVFYPTDKLTDESCTHMCESCRGKYALEKARENAGFVNGTQLCKLLPGERAIVSASGIRGVYFDKHSNKWRARLRFKGKLMNFGSFDYLEDAIEARKFAEIEYFGEILQENGLS